MTSSDSGVAVPVRFSFALFLVFVRFFSIFEMNCAKYFVIAVSFILTNSSASADTRNGSAWSIVPSFVSKLYNDCELKDYELVDCLKIKVISLLDRVGRSDVIELDESLSLVREGKRVDSGRALTENDIENTITANQEKGSALNQMLFDRVSKFFGSHVLKIGLPKLDVTSIAKSLEEGNFQL